MHSFGHGFWLFFHSWIWASWCVRLALIAFAWVLLGWAWWFGTRILWKAAQHIMGDPVFGPDPFAMVLGIVASGCLALVLIVTGLGFAGMLL